jgi:hypothetical protein
VTPVIARRPGPDRLIRLADVLITAPPDDRFDALFAEFPGLALILIAGPGRTVRIGTRDGATATLLLDPATSVRRAAVVLHQGWVVAKSTRPR